MIYCLDPTTTYPQPGQFLEEITYKDENGFEWRIARVNNGFFVRYYGDSYFRESVFECETIRGDRIMVYNTGCLFFATTDFETFCHVRDILKNGWTDDIWDIFTELFTERFNQSNRLLEIEIPPIP